MTTESLPAPKPAGPTARENIRVSKELAAAMLPVLVERLNVQVMHLNDPEVTGKAIDRMAKLAGAMDDKTTTNLPVIHFNITSAGANVSVKSKPKPVEVVDEATSQVEVLDAPDPQPSITIQLDEMPTPWAAGLLGAEDE